MELVMDRWQRRMVFGVVPTVIVGLVVVAMVVTWGDLPDPVATRFHPEGRATGSTPRATWLLLQLVSAALCAGALLRIGRRPTPDSPVVGAVAAFIGCFVGAIGLFIALANDGHGDWHDVTLGPGAVAGALGGAIGWTIPVVLMARRIAPARPAYPNRAIPFGPDDRPAWFGHTHSIGFAVAGAVNIVLGLVVAVTSELWVGLVLVLVGLSVAAFTSVTVTIDERGIGVRSGIVGWPRVRLPLDVVEEAEPTVVRPMAWGGWGYRGSLRLFRRAAWVLRAGEGLQLRLRGGRRFVVSIDDADEAAAVLNGLLARRVPAADR
jgi:hypothetical protein